MEYCDSPVGTGKTTAIMAHMLKEAQTHHLRHIFVVLPYTNIISQTVEILRKAVVLDGENPEEAVAEHHHQADFEDPEYRRLATLWTAPIIVTTAVQFFETLAGNLPAKLRKLHQLPGSGIIFDEYHAALPVNLMLPAWEWMNKLVSQWGCRICMCSATAVKFWEISAFQNKGRLSAVPRQDRPPVESLLSPEVSERLNTFEQSRIILNAWSGSVLRFKGAAELAACLNQYHGSKIVVLDTVQSAAFFAQFLRRKGCDVLHLSTALTPEDREYTIAKVKRRLSLQAVESQRDWTLVATSCVECGIDFSFRYGFCELRSLQSYVQLSGRVRRNGEKAYEDAVLFAFTITEDCFTIHPGFDDSKSVFEKMIFSGRLSAMSVTEAVTVAFREEYKLRELSANDICKAERLHEFEAVAQKFRVIDEDTVTVAASQALIARIKAGERVSARELQRGSVHLRRSVLARLGLLLDNELPILSANQYDDFLGYMKSLIEDKTTTNKPPYTITVKAADYLAKIVEAATRLEFGTDFKRDIKLHRQNRVRTIHSSLAIEGNTLSFDEVTAVIDGKLVAGKQEEIKEVKNAYEAYDKIMTFDPYAVKDFLKAHKLMMQGLINEAGKFRSGDVGVFDGDVAVHIGARPQFVPELITELFGWAKESELHPVLKSAIMHYELETIHPFADGNGRMGRLWQTILLAKWNEIFAWIPMESVLYQNRSQYYQAIAEARKANDSGLFIEFTLSALLDIITAQGQLYRNDGAGQ
jgi:Fic family protein